MNKIIAVLASAAGVPVETLLKVLAAGAAALPDVAPAINKLIADIQNPLTADNLAALADILKTEIPNIAQGKLEPKDHPSDLG